MGIAHATTTKPDVDGPVVGSDTWCSESKAYIVEWDARHM